MRAPTRPRTLSVVAGILALGLALTVLGVGIAPDWSAVPGPDARAPQDDTAPRPARVYHRVREQEIPVPTWRGELAGTAVLPTRADGAPGVVLVGGAGRDPRSSRLPLARELAARGLGVLVVEKDTTGYGPFRRDYGALARDARDAAAALRGVPGVDPARVGYWGHSEGGWVVTIAAGDDPSAAFAVLASAPVVTPGEEVTWMATEALHRVGLDGLDRFVALEMRQGRAVFSYVDARPPLAGLDLPVLAVFGAEDAMVPVVTALDRLDAELPEPPAVHILPGIGHSLTRADGRVPPDDLDRLAGWVMAPDASRSIPVRLEQLTGAPPAPALPAASAVLLHAPLASAATAALVLVVAHRRRASARDGEL